MHHAEAYERHFVPAMFRPWAECLLRHAGLHPGARVLDVACGTGIVAREAAPQVGPEGLVAALDLNPDMLALGRSLPPPEGAEVAWREGSALALPYGDGAFDVALCQHALSFFPDRVGALREMRRVLAPGGRAVVMVLQPLARHPVFEALMGALTRRLGQPLAAFATPFALGDEAEFCSLFTAAGFGWVDLRPASIQARFPEADRFVPLAVASSAAAVPAFAGLDDPSRRALLAAVAEEAAPVLRKVRNEEALVFPMYAHVGVART